MQRPRDVPQLLGRMLGALASGLLLDLAFPPHDVWWLAPVAVGLLTLTIRGQSVLRGALLGLLHGLGLFVPLLVWSGAIAGAPAWLTLAVVEAAFLGLLGAGLAVVTRLPAWPLWGAALWVAEEALRDRVPFGGFPWGRLAFSQGHSPLTPLAALGGAPLVTLAVAAIGTALVTRPRPAVALAPVLVVAALLTPIPTDGPRTAVAVVQGNVPRLGLDAFAQRAAVLDDHAQATHQLAQAVRAGTVARPDLVIWPENASDLDPYSDPEAATTIGAAVRDIGVPVLVGAVTDGPGRFLSNRGIVWDPVTGPGATYVKRHPVPFGEYVPFRSLVRRVTHKVDLIPRDFARGDRPGVLTVGPVRLGDVICFEVAYDGVVRDVVRGGGRLLVVQTNNATFGRSGETTQQLAMGRLRAVEHGRSVVVAATSGVSAVIAPDGHVQHRSRVFSRDVTVQQVVLRSGSTLATRLGALPELLIVLVALGAVAAGVRR
ncbi:MAG: apolipoprotein N-acyltransferase [Mycobacteriales bacterium]